MSYIQRIFINRHGITQDLSRYASLANKATDAICIPMSVFQANLDVKIFDGDVSLWTFPCNSLTMCEKIVESLVEGTLRVPCNWY